MKNKKCYQVVIEFNDYLYVSLPMALGDAKTDMFLKMENFSKKAQKSKRFKNVIREITV